MSHRPSLVIDRLAEAANAMSLPFARECVYTVLSIFIALSSRSWWVASKRRVEARALNQVEDPEFWSPASQQSHAFSQPKPPVVQKDTLGGVCVDDVSPEEWINLLRTNLAMCYASHISRYRTFPTDEVLVYRTLIFLLNIKRDQLFQDYIISHVFGRAVPEEFPITLGKRDESGPVNDARAKLGQAVLTLANRIGTTVPEENDSVTLSWLEQYLQSGDGAVATMNHITGPPAVTPSVYTPAPALSPLCSSYAPTPGTEDRPLVASGPKQGAATAVRVVHSGYNDPPGSLVEARQTRATVQRQNTTSQDVPRSPPPSFPTIQSLRASIASNTPAGSNTPSVQSPALAPPPRRSSYKPPARPPFASTSAYQGGEVPPPEAGADAEPLPPYQRRTSLTDGRDEDSTTTQWGSDPKPGVILNSPSRRGPSDSPTSGNTNSLAPAAQLAHSGEGSSQFERACIAAANNAESSSRRPKTKKRVAQSASVPVGLTGDAAPSTPLANDAARPHTLPLSRTQKVKAEQQEQPQQESHGRTQKAGPARIVASARRTRASAQRRRVREQTGENAEQ